MGLTAESVLLTELPPLSTALDLLPGVSEGYSQQTPMEQSTPAVSPSVIVIAVAVSNHATSAVSEVI